MKNLLLTLFFCLLIFVPSFAQDAIEIPLIAYWSKGEVHEYDMLKVRKESRDGEVTRNDTSKFKVTLTVKDSTPEGYILTWKAENLDAQELEDKVSDKMNTDGNWADLLGGYTLEFSTTETGTFVDWLNWEVYQQKAFSFIDDLGKTLAAAGKAEQAESLVANMKNMLSSKEQVMMMSFQEIQLMFGYHGYQYELDKVTVYEQQLPNLLGGSPIDATGKMKFYEYDEETGFCKMRNEVSVEEDQVKPLLVGFAKNMLQGQEVDEEEFAEVVSEMDMDIKQVYDYHFDVEWGWVPYFSFVKDVKIKLPVENATRYDLVQIEMVK